MKRLLLLLFLAGCTNGDGERCNPLRATSDCDPGLSCVFPAAPMCGVSYCCKLDDKGNIADDKPGCQPDPDAVAACADGGTD